MDDLLKSPLFDVQEKIKSKNVSFCGWDMPMQFDGILAEHSYCRNDIALFDTSHMGEFFFKGNIEKSGINEATSIDITNLKINKCKYGFLLNEDGGVIDDLIVYRLSDDELMFVVNASRRQIDFDTLNSRISNATLEDKSMQFAKLDLQGPNSKKVLQEYFDINLNDLGFFSFSQTKIFNEYCLLSRTGYTGELGYELYIPNSIAIKLWNDLLSKGAKPAGLGSRDILRLEMGYSLYGNELSEEINPLEANLSMFINLSRSYIGKDALLKQSKNLKRILLPFKTTTRRSARRDFEVLQNDRVVGIVTSATYSPITNTGIGFALVDIASFDKTQVFQLKDKRASINANITTLPFIKLNKK